MREDLVARGPSAQSWPLRGDGGLVEIGTAGNGTAVVVVTIGQRRPVGRMRVWHVHCE